MYLLETAAITETVLVGGDTDLLVLTCYHASMDSLSIHLPTPPPHVECQGPLTHPPHVECQGPLTHPPHVECQGPLTHPPHVECQGPPTPSSCGMSRPTHPPPHVECQGPPTPLLMWNVKAHPPPFALKYALSTNSLAMSRQCVYRFRVLFLPTDSQVRG